MPNGTDATERRFSWASLLVFAVVTAFLCSRHEPWHDELQAWRIAIDSGSIRELLANLRYEGHPPLFHAVLRVLGLVSPSWTAAVVLHWLIACGSAWLVLRHAPFSRMHRALIVAGYFMAFEYAVIVRPYGPGLFCALAACAAWCAPVRRGRVAAAFLVLMANTSALGAMVAVSIGVALLIDATVHGGSTWWSVSRNRRRAAIASAFALTTLVTVALLVLPPSDADFRGGIGTPFTERLWMIGLAMSAPARVFAPLAGSFPDGTVAWSTWLFEPAVRADVIVTNLAAMLVVVAGCVITSRRLASFVLWVAACAGLLAFFGLIYLGSMRHHGHLFIALLAASWLAFAPRRTEMPDPLGRRTVRLQPWRERLLTVLLVPMVAGTVQVGVAEIRSPFSDAQSAATYIARSPQRSLPIVGMSYTWSQPVAALLGRPVHFPSEARVSTFLARTNVVEGALLGARTDSVVQSLLREHCGVLLLTGKTDTAFIDMRSARRLRSAPQTPLSDNPIDVWLIGARRCASR
ncbi:MAG TPA: hypothetical protein VE861_07610 [Gemmatimonadaceae bacterium]|nr:hypothetical protein [Gemmatimonadaceae bacterium]